MSAPPPEIEPSRRFRPNGPNALAHRLSLLSLIVGLIFGLPIGVLIGARYGRWNHDVQIWAGLLPPYARKYDRLMPHALSLGMRKEDVIQCFALEQVVVLPGKVSSNTWRWVTDGDTRGLGTDPIVEL
ncbi:MAG: hypothetical protein M1457_08615 [bacterium]|nr:hypothetical protein [bacterium]